MKTDEKAFDPIEFLKQWGKYKDMTFAESASKSLQYIISKMVKADEAEN